MNNAVLIEIESLRRATLAGLRSKYQEVFNEEPRSRHREHLFRRIAWRLQAMAEGALSERAREQARRLADEAELRKVAPQSFFSVNGEPIKVIVESRSSRDNRLPLPGTLLSRKWNGKTILAEVLPQGFRYEGQHYSSLSAVARAATGTRWNGLAFFGLAGERKERANVR